MYRFCICAANLMALIGMPLQPATDTDSGDDSASAGSDGGGGQDQGATLTWQGVPRLPPHPANKAHAALMSAAAAEALSGKPLPPSAAAARAVSSLLCCAVLWRS